MSRPRNLSRDQARRIALHAQGFGAKDRSSPVNRGHLRRMMRRLNIIQLDSVPVIIRTQYMPGFSRRPALSSSTRIWPVRASTDTVG